MHKLLIFALLFLGSCAGPTEKKPNPTLQEGLSLDLQVRHKQAFEMAEMTKTHLLENCDLAFLLQNGSISPKFSQLTNHGPYKNICADLDKKYGQLQFVGLVSSFFSKDMLIKYFRYKVKFAKHKEELECRITLTDQDKLSSIYLLYWNKEYHPIESNSNWY